MKSSPSHAKPSSSEAPGRPTEVEEATNRYLVHPVSRAVVDRLVHTRVTPNQVSVASVFAAAAGALCYLALPGPWGAVCGVVFQYLWHVLDGADGDLARRTGRASPIGELVDGVCDHVSQAMVYLAFVALLYPTMHRWAWVLGVAAAISHFVQANAYETGRKTYRRWVYGAAWMRQTAGSSHGMQGLVAGLYVGLSRWVSPGETGLEAAMEPALAAGGPSADQARLTYGRRFAPLVKRSAILSGNSRTIAAFVCLLLGRPQWFFGFEIVVLNFALIVAVVSRGRRNRALTAQMIGPQAASAPN